jgi:hypothetical protein
MLLLLLAVIAAGLYALDKLSIKHAFNGLSYDIKPSATLVEIDEAFALETTVSNAKRWPVDFLRMGELLPEGLILLGDGYELRALQRGRALVSDTYLLPRQKLTRTLQAALPRRGRYFFWGATLSAGSFLALAEKSQEFHLVREMVAPPKAIFTPQLQQLLGRFIGDISVNRFIMEDPVLTIGFRDYTDRDPMRSISWKQTARFGKLMVKNYDHTLDLTVTVLLNIDTPGGAAGNDFETLFSLTRTVCGFLENAEIPYRLVTNASLGGSRVKSLILDGFGANHELAVLELLGSLTYNHTESCAEMLAKAARGAAQGRSHILLSTELAPAAAPFLYKLRARTGKDVLVITPQTVSDQEREIVAAI